MVTQLSEYAKKQQIVQYKWANLTIRDLYLSKDVKKHELTKLSEGRIVRVAITIRYYNMQSTRDRFYVQRHTQIESKRTENNTPCKQLPRKSQGDCINVGQNGHQYGKYYQKRSLGPWVRQRLPRNDTNVIHKKRN